MPEVLTAEPAQGIIKTPTTRSATGRPLIDAGRIRRRVHRLGRQISSLYTDIDTPLVLVVILKGATVFAADLMRSLTIPAELEFVRAASYGSGTSSNGQSLRLAHMVAGSLLDRHVLLVEDIVDSGRTADAVIRSMSRLKPASLKLAALLDRPARRSIEVKIDFRGFTIPDRFVIGYGLDYAGLYRELPAIYSLS
ncbi:MAG: hypoxanthine phosphoribosyltransferase [Chloroflexi bacterium]|nr:MAG: hypoxanthine phosphoribosyltransferase [Chloroflexota bacterium]